MATPSAFHIGQQAANSIGKGFRENRDNNAIESILTQAMSSGDPAVVQNSIGKILSQVSPERQGVAIQYLQNTMQNLEQKRLATKQETEGRQAAQESGYTYGAPPTVQAQQVKDKGRDSAVNAFYGGAGTQASPMSQLGGTGIDSILNNAQGQQQQQQVQPPFAIGQQPQPPQNTTPQNTQSALRSKSDDELVRNTGSPYKEISDPAKAELRRRQEEAKTEKNNFEPEADKLEAKRVSDLSDEVEKEYHSAKEENMRLDRMEKIDKEGNVSTPALVKLLDSVGAPLGILSNPATEEYRKLETDFVRNVSKVFPGGKITNYEIQSYLKTIPSLMNSTEGRAAIVRNRKLLNDAKLVRYEAYKKIIKDNNGRKPQNLGILIEEATAEKIGKIEEEFVSGVKDQIEKFQTPIRMIDPSGQPVDIPPSQIEAAMKAGARFK